MRTVDDRTYWEYKEGVEGAFNLWIDKPEEWPPEHCTSR